MFTKNAGFVHELFIFCLRDGKTLNFSEKTPIFRNLCYDVGKEMNP